MTLSKFHTLKESTLPKLLAAASEQLDADLSDDRETLIQVIDNMDQLVFEEFIKKRSRGLVEVMENGILKGGVDWLNAGKPTGESWRGARGASAIQECWRKLEPNRARICRKGKADKQRSDHICTKRSLCSWKSTQK